MQIRRHVSQAPYNRRHWPRTSATTKSSTPNLHNIAQPTSRGQLAPRPLSAKCAANLWRHVTSRVHDVMWSWGLLGCVVSEWLTVVRRVTANLSYVFCLSVCLSQTNPTIISEDTRNSSGDEIANVNFLYDDIVHVLQNTIDSYINAATDQRGYVLERMCLPNSVK